MANITNKQEELNESVNPDLLAAAENLDSSTNNLHKLSGETLKHHPSFDDNGFECGFGKVIDHIKAGGKAYRTGWNGKGMFIAYSPGMPDFPAQGFWSPANQQYAADNGGSASVLPCITMVTATGEILMGWTPSQTDVLATDWVTE